MFTYEERLVIAEAKSILLKKSRLKQNAFDSPSIIKDFLMLECASLESEVFGVVWLDNKHKMIAIEQLFTGTVNAATVYPREVVKVALKRNAAAMFCFHNHPSGDSEPSYADKALTNRLKEALDLVDVRLLDHFVTGSENVYSFVENGLM